MAYSIYRNRIKKEYVKKDTFDIKKQHELWKKVVAENIFVVCKTPMAVSITKRTLMGFEKGCVNAKCVENLIDELKENQESVKQKITSTKFWNKSGVEMKFNAVVGNPPYQVMANGDANGSDPIYHLFIDISRRLAEMGTFIHPGRFLFDAGKTPSEWNKKMLNDEHFKVVKYWAKSAEVFPTVDIKGGVAVTMWNEKLTYGKIGTFIIYDEMKNILEKVVTKNFESLTQVMNPQNKFNLEILFKDHPDCRSNIGSDGNDKRLRPNAFEKLSIFSESQSKNQIGIHGLIRNKRYIRFIDTKYIADCPDLDSFKILVPKANGTGAFGETLSSPIVCEKKVGYTGSFIGIGVFETKNEAENCRKYIMSKFARAMLGTLKVTQDNPIETWANVPLQNFTSNSDIDWTKSTDKVDTTAQAKYKLSINEIDAQLYAKYHLTKDEITFIETHVKAMG